MFRYRAATEGVARAHSTCYASCDVEKEKGCSMMNPAEASPDRSALVYRYHERLYRLALLTTGNADAAAQLLHHAYRALPATAIDDETLLLRALLPQRLSRWCWRAADGGGEG